MLLYNLKPASGSIRSRKRVGRGQGSGMGKTSTRGGKGQTARSGYSEKIGFEGGQQPLQRRLPKIGFSSKVSKTYSINIDKNTKIHSLDVITMETIRSVYNMSSKIRRVKLIGVSVPDIKIKISDSNVLFSGMNNDK